MSDSGAIDELTKAIEVKQGYSEQYCDQEKALYDWFCEKIPKIPDIKPFEITEQDYAAGAVSLPECCHAMRDAGFTVWLWDRGYEISYSQMTRAIFRALTDTGKMTVKGRKAPVTQLAKSI